MIIFRKSMQDLAVDVLAVLALLNPLFWLFLYLLDRPNRNTKKIVILGGSNGCGKSELWCRLQGKKHDGMSTIQTEIEGFCIGKNANNEDVKIVATKDLGGDDPWVKLYPELINSDNIFVYFLVDLTHLRRDRDAIRERLRLIASIIHKKNFKGCGIGIVGTFRDKYKGSNAQAEQEIKRCISDIKGVDEKLSSRLLIINTTNNNDVEQIRKEIINCINSK